MSESDDLVVVTVAEQVFGSDWQKKINKMVRQAMIDKWLDTGITILQWAGPIFLTILIVLIFQDRGVLEFDITAPVLPIKITNDTVNTLIGWFFFMSPFILWWGTYNAQKHIDDIKEEEFREFRTIQQDIEVTYTIDSYKRQIESTYQNLEFLNKIYPRWGNTWAPMRLQRIWWGIFHDNKIRKEYQAVLLESHFKMTDKHSRIQDDIYYLLIDMAWCNDWFKKLNIDTLTIANIKFTQKGVEMFYDGNDIPEVLMFIEYLNDHNYSERYDDNPLYKFTNSHGLHGELDYSWMHKRLIECLRGERRGELSPIEKLNYVIRGIDPDLPQES